MDKKEALKGIKLFVLDMDGTFYLGNRLIDGSIDFLKRVKETGRDYIFFTNNSSKNSSFYKEKLEKMGVYEQEEKIITSGDVTVKYINSMYKDKKVFLCGTPFLREDFIKGGISLSEDEADIVIMGFDTTLTYDKLDKACSLIRGGALFLATHLDINCPTEDGFMIDCGSICAAVTLSTGVNPKYLGKPFKETAQMVSEITGCNISETAYVGDRIYTDVKTGVDNGGRGFLVLTGEADLKDVENSEVKPTCVFDSLFEMSKYL